ncbi:MAG: MarR family transcriptional regulator [Candidatus Nezhaarchaeota archaeon]|nr:MarR family transcriptional regulator [Candidatus Nezhaarchaeota archaeon]
MSSLSEVEERALKIVKNSGEVLQCDLWKALNLSSREGSRVAARLERKGLVRREPLVHNKRRTYKIVLAGQRTKVTVDGVLSCPCFSCLDIERCAPGRPINPGKCLALTKWLQQEAASMEASH